MPRSMVGLLVAVGTTMSVFAGLAHADVALATIAAVAGAASGSAAYLSLPPKKKFSISTKSRQRLYIRLNDNKK